MARYDNNFTFGTGNIDLITDNTRINQIRSIGFRGETNNQNTSDLIRASEVNYVFKNLMDEILRFRSFYNNLNDYVRTTLVSQITTLGSYPTTHDIAHEEHKARTTILENWRNSHTNEYNNVLTNLNNRASLNSDNFYTGIKQVYTSANSPLRLEFRNNNTNFANSTVFNFNVNNAGGFYYGTYNSSSSYNDVLQVDSSGAITAGTLKTYIDTKASLSSHNFFNGNQSIIGSLFIRESSAHSQNVLIINRTNDGPNFSWINNDSSTINLMTFNDSGIITAGSLKTYIDNADTTLRNSITTNANAISNINTNVNTNTTNISTINSTLNNVAKLDSVNVFSNTINNFINPNGASIRVGLGSNFSHNTITTSSNGVFTLGQINGSGGSRTLMTFDNVGNLGNSTLKTYIDNNSNNYSIFLNSSGTYSRDTNHTLFFNSSLNLSKITYIEFLVRSDDFNFQTYNVIPITLTGVVHQITSSLPSITFNSSSFGFNFTIKLLIEQTRIDFRLMTQSGQDQIRTVRVYQ